MKELPILYTGAMVRALLADQKGQTRRIISPQPQMVTDGAILPWEGDPAALKQLLQQTKRRCPYGQPGNRHWVRETWSAFDADWRHPGKPHDLRDGPWPNIAYQADGTRPSGATSLWRPSIHMPRWASRILLEVTAVRVERLQDIREADARAEGIAIEDRHMNGYCAGEYLPPAIRAYRELWESRYGASNWDTNPWVWVVEFKRITNKVPQ